MRPCTRDSQWPTDVKYDAVNSGFPDPMRIRVLRGRVLSGKADDDKAPGVAIINQSMEKQFRPQQELVRDLAATLPVSQLQTMSQTLPGVNGFWIFRLGAQLTGAMRLLALIYAMAGIYRATPRKIFSMVLRQGFGAVPIGIVVGLAATFAVTHVLADEVQAVSHLRAFSALPSMPLPQSIAALHSPGESPPFVVELAETKIGADPRGALE
jgi:hypothetical protein